MFENVRKGGLHVRRAPRHDGLHTSECRLNLSSFGFVRPSENRLAENEYMITDGNGSGESRVGPKAFSGALA